MKGNQILNSRTKPAVYTKIAPENLFLDDNSISTLSGMGQDIFILLNLLDQILSADFFSKISKLFWR